MKLEDIYAEMEKALSETTEETLARLRRHSVVSLGTYRKLKGYLGWQPLSLEDYALFLRGTQLEKMNRELEKSRQEINKRVLKRNKLKPTKKD